MKPVEEERAQTYACVRVVIAAARVRGKPVDSEVSDGSSSLAAADN